MEEHPNLYGWCTRLIVPEFQSGEDVGIDEMNTKNEETFVRRIHLVRLFSIHPFSSIFLPASASRFSSAPAG